MNQQGLKYRQQSNCLVWIEDYQEAQKLMHRQLEIHWSELRNGFAEQLNPLHESLFASYPVSYYWTCYQSEWATDIVFAEADVLRADHAVAGAARHAQLFQRRRDALLRQEGESVRRHSGQV
jgi:hypothetical protein